MVRTSKLRKQNWARVISKVTDQHLCLARKAKECPGWLTDAGEMDLHMGSQSYPLIRWFTFQVCSSYVDKFLKVNAYRDYGKAGEARERGTTTTVLPVMKNLKKMLAMQSGADHQTKSRSGTKNPQTGTRP